LIRYNEIRRAVVTGLKDYLGVPVIRTNQNGSAPPYPFVSYTVTTVATANNGTWQENHGDGIDRKLVRNIWSITAQSDDGTESITLANKAREWLEHTGRMWLKDRGVVVQSTTDITNRDNILTVAYEHKNGFDVVFYAFDEVRHPSTDYIESAELTREYNKEER
jgi:hypothetical protein